MKHYLMVASGFVVAVVVAGGMVAGISGAEEDSAKDRKAPEQATSVMKDKLHHTYGLLTSLAQEDFPALQKNAQELQRIARKQWIDNPSPEYRAQLQIFWTTLQGIEDGAERKEIEEATLAYMQMTLSCVKCHKIVRRERRLR